MADQHSKLLEKCKELGIRYSGKSRIDTLKSKLRARGINYEELLQEQEHTEGISTNNIESYIPTIVSAVMEQVKREKIK